MPISESSYSVSDYPSPRHRYPNPFFDLSRTFVPSNVKTLFTYCRSFFYKNEFINSVLYKLTEYPITEILVQHENPDIKEAYRTILNHNIKIKTLLTEIGLDYHTFGNCFVSINIKFKRYLTCPLCKESFQLQEQKDLKFVNWKFAGKCCRCKQEVLDFAVEDRPLETPDAITFVRWVPERIDIDYDPLTGDVVYTTTVDSKVKKALLNGNRKALERTPLLYINAIKNDKKIELNPDNLYHFRRPSIADDDMGWGKPILLPTLSVIWYMQILRRGNEAIAMEHVIPNRAIFPSSQGNVDPYTQMNLPKWRAQVERQLKMWKEDPNHIGIFPIPMGMQSFGGDAKALNVTPELKFLEESVINSLGVPVEFIKGGANWTGSSISLRIVENHFISYREYLLDFLNYFALPKISEFLSLPPVKVKFRKFKMSDDSEYKNLLIQLAQLGKVSDSKLLENFGEDPDEDHKLQMRDMEFQAELQKMVANRQAEAQGRGMVTQMKFQAQAEHAYLDEKAKIREALFAEDIANENAKVPRKSTNLIEQYTYEVMALPPEDQALTMNKMYAVMPMTAMAVLHRMQDLQTGAPLIEPGKQVGESGKVKAPAKKEVTPAKPPAKKPAAEKHTAQKSGTP